MFRPLAPAFFRGLVGFLLAAATFIRASLVLIDVAVAASYFPARRAAGVDPVAALRHE